jgi:hypothetical protein
VSSTLHLTFAALHIVAVRECKHFVVNQIISGVQVHLARGAEWPDFL